MTQMFPEVHVCTHCGGDFVARSCPHCKWHEIVPGAMTNCLKCGGVFEHGRCFQCRWEGEPFTDAERKDLEDRPGALEFRHLHGMRKRLRKYGLEELGFEWLEEEDPWYPLFLPDPSDPVERAIEHAFMVMHERLPNRPCRALFEDAARERLRQISLEDQREQNRTN